MPIKPAGERKTRLAGRLDFEERVRLTEMLLAHALAALKSCSLIVEVFVLQSCDRLDPGAGVLRDRGRGLNAELQAEAGRGRNLLVILPDLPFVTAEDIAVLLAAAEGAAAVAPDRHGRGTNAIAMPAAESFTFAFGPDSLKAHATGNVRLVHRRGLAFDIDTPEDFADAGLFEWLGGHERKHGEVDDPGMTHA